MDIKKIESMYQKGKYAKLIERLEGNDEMYDNEHILRLFIRSANKVGKVIDNSRIPDFIRDDIDMKWNIFQNLEYINNDTILSFLKRILSERREDILEDFVITVYDKMDSMPIYDELIEYIVQHKERPVIKKYLTLINDESEGIFRIVSHLILGIDTNPIIKMMGSEYPYVEKAFERSFSNKSFDIDDIIAFKKCFEFKNCRFIILNGNIYMIISYIDEDSEFLLRNKTGNEERVSFNKIVEKTTPLNSEDFRVYKFFKPEKARELTPCELLKNIIEYHGNAVDKITLKKELLYIFGENTQKYLIRNKKVFENCAGIQIIYGKNDRYMLTDEDEEGILNHIKRLKEPSKIRDYIVKILSSSDIPDNEIGAIIEYINENDSLLKSEIMYLLTNDNKFAEEAAEEKYFSEFVSKQFVEAIIMSRIERKKYDNDELCSKLDENTIERIFKSSDEEYKSVLINSVEKSIRLGINLYYLKWYLAKQINKINTAFPPEYIYQRIIVIADDIAAHKKSNDFLAFVRRYLFSKKNPLIVKVIKEIEKKKAKELFDVFMNTEIITPYQKDEIRIAVYSIYPDFREKIETQYEFSTKKGILKKQSELSEIINKKLPELTVRIREAADHGDLSENAEYKYSREQYRFMSILAKEIAAEISRSQPKDLKEVDADKVGFGTTVILKYDNEDKEKIYNVLGPLDSDDEKNIISYKSPLIQKLNGKKVGDKVENIEIINIEKYEEE